jgi:hypothetical protein
MARWFGSWSGTIGTATGAFAGAADRADKLPLLVAYNIYNRALRGRRRLAVRLRRLDRPVRRRDRQPPCRRHPRTGLPRGLRLHDPGPDRRT